jgi:hypothetical protein
MFFFLISSRQTSRQTQVFLFIIILSTAIIIISTAIIIFSRLAFKRVLRRSIWTTVALARFDPLFCRVDWHFFDKRCSFGAVNETIGLYSSCRRIDRSLAGLVRAEIRGIVSFFNDGWWSCDTILCVPGCLDRSTRMEANVKWWIHTTIITMAEVRSVLDMTRMARAAHAVKRYNTIGSWLGRLFYVFIVFYGQFQDIVVRNRKSKCKMMTSLFLSNRVANTMRCKKVTTP